MLSQLIFISVMKFPIGLISLLLVVDITLCVGSGPMYSQDMGGGEGGGATESLGRN